MAVLTHHLSENFLECVLLCRIASCPFLFACSDVEVAAIGQSVSPRCVCMQVSQQLSSSTYCPASSCSLLKQYYDIIEHQNKRLLTQCPAQFGM